MFSTMIKCFLRNTHLVTHQVSPKLALGNSNFHPIFLQPPKIALRNSNSYPFFRSPKIVLKHSNFHQLPKITLKNSNFHLFQPSLLSRYRTIFSPNKWNQKKEWFQVQSSYLINSKRQINKSLILLTNGFIVFIIMRIIFHIGSKFPFNEYYISKAMEEGTQPHLIIEENELILQTEVEEHLKKNFQPDKDHSYYHVIYGETGTGKSTLIRKVAKEVGKGVMHFEDSQKLFETFGSPYNNWEKSMHAVKYASKMYKKKHGKQPVIIYDCVDKLDPEILDILQDNAKDNAMSRNYIAVFVCNNENVIKRMESRNAWSRAKRPVMEIGDLNEKKSMEYLTKHKINEVEAKKLYDLVGGRIINLLAVASNFLDGYSFEVIEKWNLDDAGRKFHFAGIHQNEKHHEAICVLLNSKEINANKLREFFKDEEIHKVLEYIFEYHPSRNTVTFKSKSIEYFIQKNLSKFTK